MGNFNLPTMSFTADEHGLHINCATSECSNVLYEFFSENDFLQYNQIKNHEKSQLDLIFSTIINTLVFLSSEELVPVDVILLFFLLVFSTLFQI